MILVPAIDIINGQCVRLSKGDYDTKKVYSDSPIEVAKAFEGAGLTHLHLVDLDGARAKHIVNNKVLEAIATKTTLTVDFGVVLNRLLICKPLLIVVLHRLRWVVLP